MVQMTVIPIQNRHYFTIFQYLLTNCALNCTFSTINVQENKFTVNHAVWLILTNKFCIKK